jgi:hypothetical protein
MRIRSVRFKSRSLVVVATVMAGLAGGLIFLLKNPAPTIATAPNRPKSGAVIMEGVDINTNGPKHDLRSTLDPERNLRSGAIWLMPSL